LHALGAAPIYLYNRTQAKAQTLVESFPDVWIVILDALDARTREQPVPNVIVSTIPASATTMEEDAERTGDAVYLPYSLFNVQWRVRCGGRSAWGHGLSAERHAVNRPC
jgi:pentafunctional AROM polypeptide